ncbi:MAG: purine-binding chemotaxis protein CheW [Gammaproteobacteria bacterium]|nr:purine-binding chemotaxis protein CheW [Gammaproteobacteria bacterium]
MQASDNLIMDKLGQFLSFSLGGEEYGADILKVREIRGWEDVRAIPDTPEYIKGVLDLRGTIVPIIDLRSRFNLDQVEYNPTTVVIVFSVEVEAHQATVGVVVDSVSDVLEVEMGEIKSAPDFGTKINTKYIIGVLSQEGQMIVLLDVDKLLSPEEFGMLEALS